MSIASSLSLGAALLLLPLAARPAQPAAASPPDVIGVLPVDSPPGPGAELVELSKALRGALSERSRGVLSSEALRLRMSAQAGTASLSELDRAYAGAVAASGVGDYEGAARTLRSVVDDLENLPESEEAFALWARAMMRLSRAEGSLGRKGEAREVLERLVHADPNAAADPELFPPSFAKQLDEVRAARLALPSQKLTVTSGGRAAKVFIDGRGAGLAPLTVTLPRGRYRVTGQLGEVRVSAGTVDLGQGDQTAALDFSLAEMLRPGSGPGLALPVAQRSKGLVAAGGLLRLSRLLATSVDNEGDVRYLVGSLYDVRRGMLEREGRLRLNGWSAPAGGLVALSGFLITGEPSILVIAGSAASPALTGHPSRVKGWVAVGGAALAVGLGVVAGVEGLAASGKYADARAMLDPTGHLKPGLDAADFDHLVSQGRTASTTAWIAGGAAVGVAVVSGVLGYLSYRQTGEIGPFRF